MSHILHLIRLQSFIRDNASRHERITTTRGIELMSATTQTTQQTTAGPSPEIGFVEGAVDRNVSTARAASSKLTDRMGIMGEVRLIGGAVVLLLVLALVLNEVYGAIDIAEENPWHEIVDDLETTGVAALGLLVIALLVLAASAIMRAMDMGGLGGR